MPAIVTALSDEELGRLMGLVADADTVELKLTVPPSELRSTAMALGYDALDAVMRQVFFFDTPALDLYEAGLVVRGRRTQGRVDDTVVKLRPVVPSELPAEFRASPNVNVEVDAMPGGFVCSASVKGVADKVGVKDVVSGNAPIRKLFTKEQRSVFKANAPEGITLDELTILGPILVLKLKGSPAGYDRKLVGELWLYPDGSRIVELSTKCLPPEMLDVAVGTRLFLRSKGVDLGAAQETKTRTALEFFASELAAAGT
jgi:hypothetical protein